MLPSDPRSEPPQQQPVNPFDAVMTTPSKPTGDARPATLPKASLPSKASTSDAAALTSLHADVLNTTPGLSQPVSPSRVSHPSSVNNSPVPTRRPGNNTIGMPSPIPIDFSKGSNSAVLAPEMPGLPETEGVFLGLQQLERQQAELERRRQTQPSASSTPLARSPAPNRRPPQSEEKHNNVTMTPVQSFQDPAAPSAGDAFVDDDDENTEPSSNGGGSADNREGGMVTSQSDHNPNHKSFGRIIQNTRVRNCASFFCGVTLFYR